MAACALPADNWQDCKTIQVQQDCYPIPKEHGWKDCKNFQVPESSLWIEGNNCGNNIGYGDNWYNVEDGVEVVSGETQCDIIDSGCGVPSSEQVLISEAMMDSGLHRNHCHSRRNHCRCRNICHPSRNDCEASNSPTNTKSSSCNETKISASNVKSTCKASSTSIKRDSGDHHHSHHGHGNGHCQCAGQSCQYVHSTRMVPKVIVQPRVRYVPQVVNDDSCIQQTVCQPSCNSVEKSVETCGSCGRHRRCREAVICQRSRSEYRCNRGSASEKKKSTRKGLCW
ncbi:uncharacterized protein LOC123678579 [Harmonia axyridis]|uniref:uncharacterized protein LOC123678579 n=1 Tax=Harmonia axyridis TaxID=115357 RepID=UPI001E27514C|nr:uncharacterized protein LOC123678579 [Harmonia axyridis]